MTSGTTLCASVAATKWYAVITPSFTAAVFEAVGRDVEGQERFGIIHRAVTQLTVSCFCSFQNDVQMYI